MRKASDVQPEAAGIFPCGRFAPLVEAACGPGDPSGALERYWTLLGSEHPNQGESRLYPMIAERLGPSGARKSDPRLKFARVTAFAKNQIALESAHRFAEEACRRGLQPIFTKGIAHLFRSYRRFGVRSFEDVDCFLERSDLPALLSMARELGWSLKLDADHAEQRVNNGGALTFVPPKGCSLDIHFQPRRPFVFRPEFLRHYRDTARRIEWDGRNWLVPSDTWLLIETIEHGLCYNPVAPIRWLPDAVFLLRQPDAEIDWDFLLGAAHAARLAEVFRLGLSTIAAVGASVPREVLAALEARRPGLAERLELKLLLIDRAPLHIGLCVGFLHYFRRAHGTRLGRLVGLPGYVRRSSVRYAILADRTRGAIGRLGRRSFGRATK